MKILLCLLLFFSTVNASEEDWTPKAKMVGKLSLYGAAGGIIIGTAALAYGARKRNIFRGGSVGLYAGLIFGVYIIVSHEYQHRFSSPASEEEAPYEQEDFSRPQDSVFGDYFSMRLEHKKSPEIELPLLSLNF